MERVSQPVVLACDEAYAMPLATALRSIIDSNTSGEPLEFHVLTTGMLEATRVRVFDSLPAGSASIRWVPVRLDAFLECQTRSHISKMTYARLLIPSILPGAAKAIYLDADILVFSDLTPLWATDLQGAVVGAVLDGMDAQLKNQEPSLEEVPRVAGYFNAGVLLMDLDLWRSRQISERALDYLARHPQSPFSDQDALNVACDGQWKRLDARWNCQAHLEHHAIQDMLPEQRPGIMHFVTAGKPWNLWVPNANAVVYDAFRSRTLFARTVFDRAQDQLLRIGCRIKEASKRRAAGRVVYRFLRRIWRHGSLIQRVRVRTSRA